jgi:hypothetical protein
MKYVTFAELYASTPAQRERTHTVLVTPDTPAQLRHDKSGGKSLTHVTRIVASAYIPYTTFASLSKEFRARITCIRIIAHDVYERHQVSTDHLACTTGWSDASNTPLYNMQALFPSLKHYKGLFDCRGNFAQRYNRIESIYVTLPSETTAVILTDMPCLTSVSIACAEDIRPKLLTLIDLPSLKTFSNTSATSWSIVRMQNLPVLEMCSSISCASLNVSSCDRLKHLQASLLLKTGSAVTILGAAELTAIDLQFACLQAASTDAHHVCDISEFIVTKVPSLTRLTIRGGGLDLGDTNTRVVMAVNQLEAFELSHVKGITARLVRNFLYELLNTCRRGLIITLGDGTQLASKKDVADKIDVRKYVA